MKHTPEMQEHKFSSFLIFQKQQSPKYWYTDYNNSLFVICNNYLTHQII
jgi:hypothetical protein